MPNHAGLDDTPIDTNQLRCFGLLLLARLFLMTYLNCVYRTHCSAISTVHAVDFRRTSFREAISSAEITVIAGGCLKILEQGDLVQEFEQPTCGTDKPTPEMRDKER